MYKKINVKALLEKTKSRPFVVALSVLLFLEVFYLIRLNLFNQDAALDQDAAKLMTHMIEIIRNKTILIPDWNYMTTHEIDSAMLLAIPFYLVTKNVWISFALSNIIFIFVLGLVILTIFKNCDIKLEYGIVSCCIVLMPYGFGMLDYVNMMFYRGGQYSIKIFIPLLAIAILTFPDKKKVRDIVLSVVWLLLIFMCGFSSGPLPFVTAIVPIIGAYILNALADSDKRIKNAVSLQKTLLLLLGVVLSIVGLYFHQVTEMMAGGTDASVIFYQNLYERIQHNIEYFLYMINGLPLMDTETILIASVDGIGYLLRFAFACMLIVSTIYFGVKFFKRGPKGGCANTLSITSNYFIAIIIVNVLIHLLSSYTSPRYLLIEIICMMMLLGMHFSIIAESFKGKQYIALVSLVTACLALIWYTSTSYIKYCIEVQDHYPYCADLCQIILDNEVDNAIFIDNTEADEICRIILPDQKISNYSTAEGKFVSHDYYYTVNEASFYGERSIIFSQYFDDISQVFGEEAGEKYQYIGNVAGFNMFITDEYCLPLE